MNENLFLIGELICAFVIVKTSAMLPFSFFEGVAYM